MAGNGCRALGGDVLEVVVGERDGEHARDLVQAHDLVRRACVRGVFDGGDDAPVLVGVDLAALDGLDRRDDAAGLLGQDMDEATADVQHGWVSVWGGSGRA